MPAVIPTVPLTINLLSGAQMYAVRMSVNDITQSDENTEVQESKWQSSHSPNPTFKALFGLVCVFEAAFYYVA